MGKIEKYFGVNSNKKLSETKINRRSKRYLAKLEEIQILKEVNSLYAKGKTGQCFELLERAVRLVPNDFSPFYILGLIHEENQKYDKAMMAYTAAAILKKNDVNFWKKVFEVSKHTTDYKSQILSIEKIYYKQPTEDLLEQKMKLLKKLRKKYSIIACQIEMFDFKPIDESIFAKFSKTRHINSLIKICSKLYKCIRKNPSAQTEYFLQQTILNLYKIKDFNRIMKLLDLYYLKSNYRMISEIRIIYLLGYLNSSEYRYDKYLDFKTLINDESIWESLSDGSYAFDLANQYKNSGEKDKALIILEKMATLDKSIRAMEVLADFYYENNNFEMALATYNRILYKDPTNQEIKSKIYSIYKELGEDEMAAQYEVTNKVKEYINSIEDSQKYKYRYNEDQCLNIRNQYEKCMNSLESDFLEFYEKSKDLISDFFSNPFITLKNRKFRAFSNKHEKIVSNSVIEFDEKFSRRQLAENLIRIQSLHGLDFIEWFQVIKYTLFSFLSQNNISEASELLDKSLEIEIFKNNEEVYIQLLMIGFRISLMVEDFDRVCDHIKGFIHIYGFSSIFLLYAFSYLFPGFYFNKKFSSLQKHIQRIGKRLIGTQDSTESEYKQDEIYKDNVGTLNELVLISSFLPRFLQTETVDFINSNIPHTKSKISLISAIINITHTKSRALLDKKPYATNGIRLLKSIMPDNAVKFYNLGKAYHFFGYYDFAEQFYMKAINLGNEEIQSMAIFNLSLIFQKNKSKNVILTLISKYKES